ncbi:protein downstream neighbor of son homolog [Polypterus senegalus]
MAELPGYSPSFKRPPGLLRVKRKRARSEGVCLNRLNSQSSPGQKIPGVRPFSPGLAPAAPRPRNPFANIENTYCSPRKKSCVRSLERCGQGLLDWDQRAGAKLRESLASQESRSRLVSEPDEAVFEDVDLFEKEADTLATPMNKREALEVPPSATEFPADWSLKTRLLFTSQLPFSWAEHLKAQEEAQGLSQHYRGMVQHLPRSISEPRSCSELRCAFQQSLVYWQYPSYPWLQLFPRIGVDRKMAGKCTPWSQDELLQQQILSEWSLSFTSLYNLLRSRLCPYFYLCTYQFTVLFRSAGLAGNKAITALLSPTTRGLREAMKNEGIEFSLPLLEESRKRKNVNSSEVVSEGGLDTETEEGKLVHMDSDEEDDDDDDDGGLSWLAEMGVQDDIRKPDTMSIKLRKERSEVRLDHRPESVALVEGGNTFTLLNFLINLKSLVAVAGPQAGLPPTLLSPTAFRGASMQTLKARSVNVKTQVRTGLKDLFSLEVTGPIMPHSLHALTLLLRSAQKGAFSAVFNTHSPTAIFNTASRTESTSFKESALQDLKDCGLHPDTLVQLLEPPVLGKLALRQLEMSDYKYTWKS